MATYGKICEFIELEETWTQYVERLKQYFLANDGDDASKRRAILLSVSGTKTYALARDLLQNGNGETGGESLQEDCRGTGKACFSQTKRDSGTVIISQPKSKGR